MPFAFSELRINYAPIISKTISLDPRNFLLISYLTIYGTREAISGCIPYGEPIGLHATCSR